MEKKKIGRPRKFQTPEKMQPLIDKYFKDADSKDEPFTVPDLAAALGFDGRNGPREYLNRYPEFSSTIKRAFLRIEGQRNRQLLTEGNIGGKIFDLTNNFGWKNPQQTFKHSSDPANPMIDLSAIPDKLLNQITDAIMAARDIAGETEPGDK